MDDAVGISKINSVQNGLLMDCSLHSLFDQYLFSIDPDVSILVQECLKVFMLTESGWLQNCIFHARWLRNRWQDT